MIIFIESVKNVLSKIPIVHSFFSLIHLIAANREKVEKDRLPIKFYSVFYDNGVILMTGNKRCTTRRLMRELVVPLLDLCGKFLNDWMWDIKGERSVRNLANATENSQSYIAIS